MLQDNSKSVFSILYLIHGLFINIVIITNNDSYTIFYCNSEHPCYKTLND